MTGTVPVTVNQAMFNTLCYADIFDYPLNISEIHHWLIANQASKKSVSLKLKLRSEPIIQKTKNYYHLQGRSTIVSLRQTRQSFSQPKLIKAQRIANLLSHIPSINLIAITGALAMNNADETDDIDLMIITKNNQLWITRLLAIFLLELFHLRRRSGSELRVSSEPSLSIVDKACLNLFLDGSALTIPVPSRNLYTAHEVAQVKPIFERKNTYQKFLASNSWVKDYLPNALGSELPGLVGSELSVRVPNLLLLKLNQLAFKLQHWYMKSKLTREKVSLHSAFFHPRPTGKIVLTKYRQRRFGTTRASSEPKKQISVLVTGVFDILHLEHKKFLKAAKKQGDLLLVGLETDARVKKLKGSNRPINSLQTRIKNLMSWGIADQIFALPKKFNSQKDHRALINQIKPNILAVSSHTPNLPAKRKLMGSIGGTLKIVHPFNPKISVTKLLDNNS